MSGRRSGCIGASVGLVLVATLLGVGATFLVGGGRVAGLGDMASELRDRGRIVVVGRRDLLGVRAEGAQLLPLEDVDGLAEALRSDDEEVLVAAMREAGVGGLLVDGRGPAPDGAPTTIAERLTSYGHFDALRALYVAPTAALYVRRRDLVLEPPYDRALARVARGILAGEPQPSIRSFPPVLRRTQNVEVMVLLERYGRPRLWRSARAGSVARGLMTAASVARQRWIERQQAMGGPLEELLPSLTVRVSFLEEDGTLAETTPAFLERAITVAHGVAFEQRGSWHYLLPRATRERGGGSAVRAYEQLFSDAGLPEDSFRRRDLRFYRLVAREVAASRPAPAIPALPPSDVLAPMPGGLDAL